MQYFYQYVHVKKDRVRYIGIPFNACGLMNIYWKIWRIWLF